MQGARGRPDAAAEVVVHWGASSDLAVLASRRLNPGPAARLERAPDKMQMTISDADEFYLRS